MSITIKVEGLDAINRKYEALGSKIAGVTGTIGNNTPYGPWVGSSRFQASMHKGRWPTDTQTLHEQKGAIKKDFEVAITAAVKARIILKNPLLVAANAGLLRLHGVLASAPGRKPGSSYVRTNTYIRKWLTDVEEHS